MDPFGRLPTEVLILVLKEVSDLPSLHSLRCASPALVALFYDDVLAVEMVEAVLVRCLVEDLRGVVRGTCMLLARPPESWEAFERTPPLRLTTKQTPLLGGYVVQAAAVRRLLALSSAVHAAANRCIATVLARCAALRPRRPADPAFNYRRQKHWRTKEYTPHPPIPDEPACDYAGMAAAAAPPVLWVEAQRALCGAWQLAFYSVLREALGLSRGGPRAEQLPPPPMQSPLHLWRTTLRETVFGMSGCLQTLVEADDHGTGPDGDWPLVLQPPVCLRVADAFPAAADLPVPAAGYNYTIHAQPMPSDWNPGPWGMGIYYVTATFQNSARAIHWSPLRFCSVAPFRALGFPLWERSRMVALGFFSSDEALATRFGGNGRFAEYSDWYTWYSLLTAAERADLEDRQRVANGHEGLDAIMRIRQHIGFY